ncbi:uncharacterized protein [Littorina saxatilis]|uniref:uncharacterized protein n=1 Tax=Littorina saxatilis TaxID=31220 RepID=UPI0038B4AE98
METPATVREALRPLDWVTSVDLTDAYFHILMHEADQKWLRFEALCHQHTQFVLAQAQALGFQVNRTKSELSPTQTFTYLGMGVPIALPPPSTHLFSDASQKGWGAHLDAHTTSGRWSPEQQLWHINRLELEAVFLGLQHFVSALQGNHVLIHTDNTTVAAYLNKQGGSRSQLLSSRACKILSWCAHHEILISARYLPGCLNVLADALSRSSQVLHTEWTITHQALLRLWAQVERPMIDLFATRFSRRLPIFVSPFPDPEAWKIDAMMINWTGLEAYAFPPVPLIGKVLRKADLQWPRLLLVAPRWTSQH